MKITFGKAVVCALLGVCGLRRSSIMPKLPTISETLPGFESSGWYGLLGPAGLSREITVKLQETFKDALSDPVIKERLASQGVDVIAGSPEVLIWYKLSHREKSI